MKTIRHNGIFQVYSCENRNKLLIKQGCIQEAKVDLRGISNQS